MGYPKLLGPSLLGEVPIINWIVMGCRLSRRSHCGKAIHRSGSDLVLSAWQSVLFFRSGTSSKVMYLLYMWGTDHSFFGLKAFFQQVEKNRNICCFYGLLPVYSFLFFEGLFLENKNKIKWNKIRELLRFKKFQSCAWHVPVIGTCPVSEITLVLGKNDLHQADNSEFPGVNHPCHSVRELWKREVICKFGFGEIRVPLKTRLWCGFSTISLKHERHWTS